MSDPILGDRDIMGHVIKLGLSFTDLICRCITLLHFVIIATKCKHMRGFEKYLAEIHI